jgi:FdhD protein
MNDRPVLDRPSRTVEAPIAVAGPAGAATRYDRLATEEPLEIRLRAGGAAKTIAITMRTPGNDFELAAGFLYGEGAIGSARDLESITYCLDADLEPAQRYNVVNVGLRAARLPPLEPLERHFTTTSACGVCGKAGLEALATRAHPIDDAIAVPYGTIVALPERLRERQRVFAATGGLHAAAFFDASGRLIELREDVGRHNALDKLVGWSILQRQAAPRFPIVLVSGRSSYEIVQKAIVARVPIVCSVSAPSSLAVELANAFGITLIGFLRGETFNLYAHPERITFGHAG